MFDFKQYLDAINEFYTKGLCCENMNEKKLKMGYSWYYIFERSLTEIFQILYLILLL